MKSRSILTALMLLIFASWAYATDNAVDLKLTLEQRAIPPDQARAIRIDNQVYLSLSFFSTALHAATKWDNETGTATIKLGSLLIQMTAGNPTMIWDGKSRALSYAPLALDGGVWIPVETVRTLGMELNTANDAVDIVWKRNYLLFIKSTTYQGRPAVVFQTTGGVRCRDFLLAKPDRLVLDLEGVERFPYLEEDWTESYAVRKIRINRFRSDLFRMVFDLNCPLGYRIVIDDDARQAMVVFDALIRNVAFDPHDGDPRVTIDGSSPLQFKMTALTNPQRLVVDIPDAALAVPANQVAGDGTWIKRIRMSQFDGHTVRVVLDLASPRACYIVSSKQCPERLTIRTQQEIRKIEWVAEEKGGCLKIQSSGEIEEEFTHLRGPERLIVGLRYAKIGANCSRTLEVNLPPLRGVKVSQDGPSEVRVEIGLDFYLGYEATFSEDRRTLIIRMRESPLLGKVIVLDPGHGGADPGAMGSQGVREKEVNLEVAFRLKDLLDEAGAKTLLTRLDDEYVGLYERAAIANQAGAAVFISLHTNFHPDPKVTGIEIFHYPERANSRRLALLLLEETAKATGLAQLSVKTNKEFVVTRETQMPSVLVEMGFLSNYQEETIIGTPEFRDNMAHGIFQALVRYWSKDLNLEPERTADAPAPPVF